MNLHTIVDLSGFLSLSVQKTIIGLVFLMVTIFIADTGKAASPGALDLSFGMRGTSVFNIGPTFHSSQSIAIQPDGKSVLAGFVVTCLGPTCNTNILVVRYNVDGSIDNTFGANGAVVTDYSAQDESAFAVAVQSDGKIVVAAGLYDLTSGMNILGFKLVRYLSDGNLDSGFGVGGRVYESFDDLGGTPRAMVIQPDGKIVVAGLDDNSMLFVARFNTDGSLDSGFGTNGTIASGAYNVLATTLVRQSDGKLIVVAGSLPLGTLKLIRFNANGTPDNGFGTGGIATFTFDGRFTPTAAVQSDDKIIVSGAYSDTDLRIPPLKRFNANGSPDDTFVPFHGEINGSSCVRCTQKAVKILLLADGRFYLAGSYRISRTEIAVSRYLSSGSIDPSFGFRGLSLPKHSNSSADLILTTVNDAALQSDGKVIVTSTHNTSQKFFTTRINATVTAPSMRGDFDGDRKTDFAVFRPSSRFWYVLNSFDSSFYFERYGAVGDLPLPGDYNYDAKTDLSVYRPSENIWYVSPSPPSGGGIGGGSFGIVGDINVPDDYDGDGYTDLAIFRPSNGSWTIRYSGQPSISPLPAVDVTFPWGTNNDKPVPGDYDGDGRADLAVFRPSNGYWYILRSSDSLVTAVQFGLGTDQTVQGDYDGDLKTDIAVFRSGSWYILRSSDNGFIGIGWGANLDKPVPGDYDADGKFDVAVYRPSEGIWYVLKSSDSSVIAQPWGISEDTPIPFTFVR